jgi:hypothetical protein
MGDPSNVREGVRGFFSDRIVREILGQRRRKAEWLRVAEWRRVGKTSKSAARGGL